MMIKIKKTNNNYNTKVDRLKLEPKTKIIVKKVSYSYYLISITPSFFDFPINLKLKLKIPKDQIT